jgi:hypothetical protein
MSFEVSASPRPNSFVNRAETGLDHATLVVADAEIDRLGSRANENAWRDAIVDVHPDHRNRCDDARVLDSPLELRVSRITDLNQALGGKTDLGVELRQKGVGRDVPLGVDRQVFVASLFLATARCDGDRT